MSASAVARIATRGWSGRDIRTVRYALGATAGMAIATGIAWELSYLVPVLSLSFLAAADKPIGPRAGLAFIALVGAAAYFGWLLGSWLIPYPGLYIPFAGLVLFGIFYAGQRGRSKLLVMWLLLAVTIIPLVRMLQPSIAVFVAQGIFKSVIVTVIIAVSAFALIREPRADEGRQAPAAPPRPVSDRNEAFRNALVSTVVVLPLMSLFYLLQFTGGILILVFVGMLSAQPAFAANFKVGKALLVGNIVGGVISITFYELLVAAPIFVFMLLMTFAVGLVLGWRVFSGKPVGAVFGLAFSTTLLIIGSTTTSTDDAGGEVYTRILQITMAVLYVVGAFGLLNRLFPGENNG